MTETTMASTIAAMTKCEQFPGQSILDHGLDCAERLTELLTGHG